MKETEIAEIAQRVRRISHRIKNVNNQPLHKEALRTVNRIARKRNTDEALAIESEFIKKLQQTYENPVGIIIQPPVMNMSDAYGDDDSGKSTVDIAAATAKSYNDADVTYVNGGDASGDNDTSDCSHFVHDVLTQAGFDVPYTTTGDIANSDDFTKIDAANAKPGDVIVQGGHMGIYTGTDDKGRPLGTQMGTSGAKNGPWGPGGWFPKPNDTRFYRPN